MTTLRKLQHAFTQHDIRNSKRRGYNPYALARYLQIADEIAKEIETGEEPRKACTSRLNDRLLDVALGALGLPKASLKEIRGCR